MWVHFNVYKLYLNKFDLTFKDMNKDNSLTGIFFKRLKIF